MAQIDIRRKAAALAVWILMLSGALPGSVAGPAAEVADGASAKASGPDAVMAQTAAAAAAHNALLPAPQEVRYGPGRLPVRELVIRVDDPSPAAEDLFAARELASWLTEACGFEVLVAAKPAGAPPAASTSAPAIVLRRTGEVAALPVPDEPAGPTSRESFEARITPQGVTLEARSSAGLYYAAQTLRQMVEGRGEAAALPEAEVRDWPAFAYRGYMMDFSHAQLPTPEEVRSQLDFLARFKANHYLFYTEASIELEGYPTLMAEARYTQAEVRAIIDYARERHIDVIPNMELYGHLHDLFRMERYADLAVIPHGGEFKGEDPRIGPLLEDWIGQMARLFPSPFFHMGFDETWLIRSEAARTGVDPGDLYLKRLKQVAGIIARHGKRPMAYADMMEHFPKIVGELPAGLTAFVWKYFPLDPPLYDRILAPFVRSRVPVSLLSAVINWSWLVTDYDRSFRNIDLLAAAGRKHGALGLYQSGWTDDTQTLTRPGRPALAYAAVAGWQSVPVDRAGFFGAYGARLYPPAVASAAAGAFDALARAETSLQEATSDETIAVFFEDPFAAAVLEKSDAKRQALRATRLACDEALGHILRARASGVDPATFVSLEACARMIDTAALKHIYAREIADFWRELGPNPDKDTALNLIRNEVSFKYHTRTSDMMDALSVIKDRFREAWLAEFTPYRLNIALAKFDVELAAWWKLQRRFQEAVKNVEAGLTPLQTLTQGLW
jgi:hexosaminidase